METRNTERICFQSTRFEDMRFLPERRPRPVPRPVSELTGRQIRRFMAAYKVTVRDLARRMGITQIRVREVRRHGVCGAGYVRDWMQGITGRDPETVVRTTASLREI